MYNIVLFDMDGTLTDSKEGIFNGIRYSLSHFGIEENNEDRMRSFIGPPIVESVQKHYGFNEEKAELALDHYRTYYRSQGLYENKLYPHVHRVLGELKAKGIRMLTATAKGTSTTLRVIDHFQLDPYFEFVSASELKENRVTKSQIISYALENIDYTPSDRVLMVGDRSYDIVGGQENGLDTLAVTYGYGSELELIECNPTYTAQDLLEVKDIILTH